jgi:hypothetical protein
MVIDGIIFSTLRTWSCQTNDILFESGQNDTYDHRTLKIRLPVRSAIYKQCTGGLVVRWVTTSESPLLYVFAYLFFDATTYITCPSLFRRSACDEYLVERNH